MFLKWQIVSICFIFSLSSFASLKRAQETYGSGRLNSSKLKSVVIELIKDGYYFSALPWLKESLIYAKSGDRQLNTAIDDLITNIGVKPLEILPFEILKNADASSVNYIIAKKLFGLEKFEAAYEYAVKINSGSNNYPFALNIMASIRALKGDYDKALPLYQLCQENSDQWADDTDNSVLKRQFRTNEQYCIAGVARSRFATGKHDQSTLDYLDIDKSFYVWPEILFEEAWNAYYRKNYNRTLGKLVSYKAPVFAHIYGPENDVLAALSYLRLCKYSDARKVVDNFFDQNMNGARKVRALLLSKGKDYNYYYQLIREFEQGRKSSTFVLNNMLEAIKHDAAYLRAKHSLEIALREIGQLRSKGRGRFVNTLIGNIRDSISTQQKIIGGYVRSSLLSSYTQLFKSLEGMSNIKLEILSRKKAALYENRSYGKKKEGDPVYLETNDKQYFWDFNGEFWADELGDYVFALKSEC